MSDFPFDVERRDAIRNFLRPVAARLEEDDFIFRLSQVINSEAAGRAAGAVQSIPPAPYDMAGFLPGRPAASVAVLSVPMARAFTFPTAMSGSRARALQAATAAAVFSLRRNNVEIVEVDPNTSGAWSAAAVDALEAGVEIVS